MIKFYCKNCGQKIKAPKLYAGKKGKCPKCKSPVVVPPATKSKSVKNSHNLLSEASLDFPPSSLQHHPPDLKPQGDTVFTDNPEASQHIEQDVQEQETKPPQGRKLPWIVDIFLYPTSTSGIANLGIFLILPYILELIPTFIPFALPWLPLKLAIGGCIYIFLFIVIGYMYFFLMECIRDSAAGGTRSPENIANLPDSKEAVSQLMGIVALNVITWGPAFTYWMYQSYRQSWGEISPYDPTTDKIFWILIGYGIFFFPMGLLVLAMLGSTSAFNPLLWIKSIASTFLQYLGLVLLLCIIALVVLKTMTLFRHSLLLEFLSRAIAIYMAMVGAHLVGRFYYANAGKLNWEV